MPEDTGIVMVMHCTKCLNSLPVGKSPREWNRTETGFTADGRVRVWCVRHEEEVVTLVKAND